MVLAPASVVALDARQPGGRGREDGIVAGHTRRAQALDDVEDRVREVDPPRPEERAIGTLARAEESSRRARSRARGGAYRARGRPGGGVPGPPRTTPCTRRTSARSCTGRTSPTDSASRARRRRGVARRWRSHRRHSGARGGIGRHARSRAVAIRSEAAGAAPTTAWAASSALTASAVQSLTGQRCTPSEKHQPPRIASRPSCAPPGKSSVSCVSRRKA